MPVGSCWDLLGNLFEGINLTDTFHWPVAPLYLENGHEAKSCNSHLESWCNMRKRPNHWGKQRRKMERGHFMKWRPSKFLKAWDKYISWVFHCLQWNKSWLDTLLLLTALLGPIEIQRVHSMNHCGAQLQSKWTFTWHDRKKVLVLMTSLGTSYKLWFLTRIDKVDKNIITLLFT